MNIQHNLLYKTWAADIRRKKKKKKKNIVKEKVEHKGNL
jgi:hypothetical protein